MKKLMTLSMMEKLNFKKMYRLSAIAVFLIAMACGVLGCIEQEDSQHNASLSYIHIDIPNDYIFSSHQLEMLAIAYQRADEFIRIDGDVFTLNASAKDLNLSDELFYFIQERIEIANRQREINDMLIQQGIKVDLPMFKHKTSLIKTRSEVGFTYGPGYYQRTVTLSHDQAITYMNLMQTGGTVAGLAAGIASWGAPLQGFILGSYAGFVSLQWGMYENRYLDSGSYNGIILTETTFTGSTFPGYTVYTFTIL